MIYTTDIIGDQWKIFFEAVAVGFVLGGCYDILRLLRFVISPGKKFFIVSDFLFCIWAGFITFSFLLERNFGIPRFYIFLGESAGFCGWYFSIGRITKRFGKLFRKAVVFVFSPFIKIFQKILKKVKKPLYSGENFVQKAAAKQKRLLKNKSSIVYNILCLDISKAFSHFGEKTGKEHEKTDGSGTEETQKSTFFEDSGHCVRNLCSLFPDFDPGGDKQKEH